MKIQDMTSYNIANAIHTCSLLGCTAIAIIVGKNVSFEELIDSINIGSSKTTISGIDIYMNYDVYISDKVVEIIKQNRRFTNFYFRDVKNPEILTHLRLYNFYKKIEFTDMISKDDFRVNPDIYNESLKYNNYFNKKILINANGEIFI